MRITLIREKEIPNLHTPSPLIFITVLYTTTLSLFFINAITIISFFLYHYIIHIFFNQHYINKPLYNN
jgi:hypothetical protein